VRQRALGTEKTTAEFNAQLDHLSSSFLAREGKGAVIRVEVDAITDVLVESKANVLILDVEGSEIDLLGAAGIQQIDKMIVEFHPQLVGMDRVSETVARLQTAGLRLKRESSYGKVLVFTRH
jgi:hypothetical protein